MALIDSLVSYYKMDEASGDRADAHASNTLTDSASGVGVGTAKLGANASAFVAADSDYFIASGSTVFDVTTGDFSFAFWINSADPATGARILWKRVTATGQGYYVTINASDQIFVGIADAGGTNYREGNGSTDIADGTYHHVVITWTGSTDATTIHVDGGANEYTSSSSVGTVGDITNAETFQMGRDGSGVAYLTGTIDEVGFWTKVLSSTEISDLYNAGAGFAYPFTAAAGPVRRRMMTGVGA